MDKLKPVWDNASTFGRVVIVATTVLVVLTILGVAIGDDSESGDGDEATTSAATTEVTGPTPEKLRAARKARRERQEARRERQEARRERQERARQQEAANKAREQQEQNRQENKQAEPSAKQRVREALGDDVSSGLAVGDTEVRSVDAYGQLVSITLSTPEGGFGGPSSDDTDALASAAFAKVYEDADWRGSTYVEFRGGLIDTATGRDVPSALTASYRMRPGPARQIDWSDEEALFRIDWGIYRLVCHPAIKGC